jgi:hypothetical protein
MKIEIYILKSFIEDVEKEGLFWRINRQNTFIDLLMLDAHKAAKKGIDVDLATNIILTALKAIINDKYGRIAYGLDFENTIKQVTSEKESILLDVKIILSKRFSLQGSIKNTFFDDLNYFTVLNNLKIDNYSVNVFENILDSFMSYLGSNL